METEKRSTQLWQRLRLAAAMKELDVLGKSDSWSQLEHEDDDPRPETKEPLVKGWRWLKAVSMMMFSGRAYHKTEMVPLCKPAKSGSDNSVAEAKTDVGATRPQLKTTAQVQLLIPSQDPAGLGINNSAPDVVVDLPSCRRRSPAPQPAQVVAVHAPTVDQMKELGRCLKYSQKALSFAVCTFIGFASSAKPTGNTTFKLAIAPFFVAICADLYSLKTKAKLGTALVYLSSFHLVLMIYIVFISFNMHYAYTIPFLPLVAGASLLQQKIWPEGQQKSTDEKVSKDLDSIFELSTLILNWSTFITAILAIFRRVHLIPEPNKYVTFNVVGLLFFLTIVLGLYLMLVTTVRSVALNLRSKYLDVLLICLLVSTLIAALIMFT